MMLEIAAKPSMAMPRNATATLVIRVIGFDDSALASVDSTRTLASVDSTRVKALVIRVIGSEPFGSWYFERQKWSVSHGLFSSPT
jgi:hypothetical protein